MSKTATTLYYWSFYLLLLGAVMVIMPNFLLVLFGFPASEEIWPRVIGVLILVLAYFSYQSARGEVIPYFHWSVHARVAVFLIFIVFVILRLTSPAILFFGFIDLLGAAWTYFALRSSSAQ